MKLSALVKPAEVDLPLHIGVPPGSNFIPLPDDEDDFERARVTTQRRNDDVEIETSDEDDFEQQLVIAVDYIRRMQNYLAFIHENNSSHEWLGDKSASNLQDLVEEVEDFLGDYAT